MSIDALLGCGYNSDIGKATCLDTDRYNGRSLDVYTALIRLSKWRRWRPLVRTEGGGLYGGGVTGVYAGGSSSRSWKAGVSTLCLSTVP